MTFPEIDKLCSCGDFDNKYVEIFQKEKEKNTHTHTYGRLIHLKWQKHLLRMKIQIFNFTKAEKYRKRIS